MRIKITPGKGEFDRLKEEREKRAARKSRKWPGDFRGFGTNVIPKKQKYG